MIGATRSPGAPDADERYGGTVGRRRIGAAIAATALTTSLAASLVAAHEEYPDSAPKHTIARGKIPTGGRYHFFGQKASLKFPHHVHLGKGRHLCLTIEDPRGSGGGCGPPPRRPARTFVLGAGFSCRPAWSDVYGIVGPRAYRVYARLGNARRVRARIRSVPRELDLPERVRFFIAVARGGSGSLKVWAVDARGHMLKRGRARGPASCDEQPEPPPPPPA